MTDRVLDPSGLPRRLERLVAALADMNPTMANLELSRHLERIDCFPDGRIVVRGTYLGLFEGAAELLRRCSVKEPALGDPAILGGQRSTPRRRSRLRVPDLTPEGQALQAEVDRALDPNRFAGLPEEVMWTETFWLEKTPGWAEQHAEEVYEAKERTGLSFNKLAVLFKKSRPTVQHAWEIAAARRGGSTTENPAEQNGNDAMGQQDVG
jgi:hypothetical protein